MSNHSNNNDSQNSLQIKNQTMEGGTQNFANKIEIHQSNPSTPDDLSENANDILIKKASELIPKDLLKHRAQERFGFKEDYFSRPELDDELLTLDQQSKNIIITGKPLAGKSRAIFHFLTQTPNAVIFFPNETITDNLIRFLKDYSFDKQLRYFFILNDIDDFVEDKPFSTLLSLLTEIEDLTLIASCRRSELNYVESGLDDLWVYFHILSIPALDSSVKQRIESRFGKNNDLIPDDTIGSFFFPLSTMTKNYKALPVFEKEILRSYKCVEIWRKNNRGSKAVIKAYTEKRLQQYHGESENLIPPVKWDNVFAELNLHGFIENLSEKIYIEPAYIDRIIAIDDNEEKMALEIVSYYPDVISYSKLLNRVSTLEIREQLVIHMQKADIQGNLFTFNILLNKTKTLKQAQAIFTQMQEADIQGNVITFNSLLNKTKTFEQAQAIFTQMQEADIQGDLITFSTLLNKTKTFEQAQAIFTQIQKAGIQGNLIFFNTLLNKTKTFEQAQAIFTQMQKANIQGDLFTFNTLLNKTKTFEQAQAIFTQMQEAGIQGNLITFNTLLNKTENFEQTLTIFIQMQKLSIQGNLITWNTFLKKIKEFEQIQAIFIEIQKTGIQTDLIMLSNMLLNKTKGFEQAQAIFTQIQEAGIQGDLFTFNILLKKTKTFAQAQDIFTQMQEVGIQGDLITFNTWLNKIKTFEQAQAIFTEMQEADIQGDSFTSNILKAKHLEQERFQNGFIDATDGFNRLIEKTNNFLKAWEIYHYMKCLRSYPNDKTFALLYKLASTEDEYWKVKEEQDKHDNDKK